MPYSIVHTELAFKTAEELEFNENQFQEYIVGSIFVDANYLLQEYWFQTNRRVTHYYEDIVYEKAPFPEDFLKKEWISSPFCLGYYFHLLTDRVWRDSSAVGKAYRSEEMDNYYQISRKIHSYHDLQILLGNKKYLDIIEKSRLFRFEKEKIPSIFHSIPKETLEKTYNKMVDFMLGKDFFMKESEKHQIYKIENWVLHITDKDLERKVLQFFPYEEYLELKKEALAEFQLQVLPKIW